MGIFKQKITWIGMLIVLVVLVVFGAAMMGSVLGTKPKDVPVALVTLDQSVNIPTGGSLAVGEMLKQKLMENDQLPISWTIVSSEEEARAGIDNREYYGAMILPVDLSAGIASLAGPSPKPATVQIIVSEGASSQAATLVKQSLGQVMKMTGAELSKSMLVQMGEKTQQVPVAVAQALLSPINVQDETVHAVGTNNAAGNAPGLLTQIMWMGSLVTALILFMAGGNAMKAGASRLSSISMQPAAGVVIVGIASGFLVWMASSWYGMELAQAWDTWLFLWLVGATFYMLQSALLNWMGMPAMGILVLLMFFSMPLLNMAPEFLSQTSHDWIYSWTPLRFAAVGMREVMYFGGLDAVSSNAYILWYIAGGFLLILLAAIFKREKAVLSQASLQKSY
ncbi:YhgE/Pip domain-containing protein [Paenibacillus sp. TAF43_2]|uniref:YhgE/Pip domain-containing protein n=1 Tax=Paenibacillus sp. TAF43_2 TaxID=3233069 RepID=UPI003F9AED91